jgi:hypothetical protein
MVSFIKACEVWALHSGSSVLEFVAGHYGDLEALKSVSEKKCFPFDRGLPGKAWCCRHPIILTDLNNGYFERADVAREAGLTAAIAMPVFSGDTLVAVLVLLCDDDENAAGAIELWHCNGQTGQNLNLIDGYFGRLKHFELISRQTSFARGVGLPGIAWDSGMPKLLNNLGSSYRFIRAEGAHDAGITNGFAVPFFADVHEVYIMSFLSALGTPIARQIELWIPSYDNKTLLFFDGFSQSGFDLRIQYATVQINSGEGILGRTHRTFTPEISTDPSEIYFAENAAAQELNMRSVVTFPVVDEGFCKCVIALYS